MKKIILDACTIILLAKASALETVAENYETMMTEEVYREVIEGKIKQFQDALLTERLKEQSKIKIIKSDARITNKLIQDFNMAGGEASTIATGVKNRKMIIATDNKQGRNAAKIHNISLVGSPDIIVALYKQKKIHLDKALIALKIIKDKGWFDMYLIEKASEDLK